MKNCPQCNSEIVENFELCWNCNYSFTEEKVIKFKNDLPAVKEINCLRCNILMRFSGNYKFHEGPIGVSVFVNRESFDVYKCVKCGKIEFFSPQKTV